MIVEKSPLEKAQGSVIEAFGNLLHVRYEGSIMQGEVVFVHLKNGLKLKAEVIEINSDVAKIQVYEDTKGISLHTEVVFEGELLEAELGPGLLTSIFDGLQNPLEKIADQAGLFLQRGVYLPALDRQRKWDFEPRVKPGQRVERGDTLGEVLEGRFRHKIMVPFKLFGSFEVVSVVSQGSYRIEDTICTIKADDGKEHKVSMLQKWPIKAPLQVGEKIKPRNMMDTGCRIIDTQFPIIKGGTFCSPGPFGAGKTVLQHHLAKYSSVDIVIVAACGERAGEVVEILREFPHLTDPHTGETLMTRTVIICNTSSMPVSAREASIYMGVTLAEYYRQMGLSVLLLADSTSRWAQALREMSGRLEEIPGEEAFPAYLASRIAEFYERSGMIRLKDGKVGSLTIGGAVSPAGGNFEEPVTQATLSVVGAFLGLSRERSDSRRYPAVDPLISWSKYLSDVSKELDHEMPGYQKLVERALSFLQQGHEIGKRMEVVGEEGISIHDLVIYLKSELYDFSYLQQNAFDKEDAYCPLKRQLDLFALINLIFETEPNFSRHEEARNYYLKLQNRIRNLNFLPFGSEEYEKDKALIEQEIVRDGS